MASTKQQQGNQAIASVEVPRSNMWNSTILRVGATVAGKGTVESVRREDMFYVVTIGGKQYEIFAACTQGAERA